LRFLAAPLCEAVHEAREAARWLIANSGVNPAALGAGSYAFMHLVGTLALGWMWLRMAGACAGQDSPFHAAKLVTARYYAERWLPACTALTRTIEAGPEALMALDAEAFARG
jgi:hypothetical protein